MSTGRPLFIQFHNLPGRQVYCPPDSVSQPQGVKLTGSTWCQQRVVPSVNMQFAGYSETPVRTAVLYCKPCNLQLEQYWQIYVTI